MDVVAKVRVGASPMLIMLFVLIGLFIFLVTRFGKGRPAVIGLSIGGFILGVFALVFLPHFFGVMVPMFILPVIVIVGLVVFALVKAGGGKAGGAVAIGILLVLLGLGALFAFKLVSQDRRVVYEDVPATVSEALEYGAVPSVWHEGVEREYPADVYASRRAAMFAVVKRVMDEGSLRSKLADERISREIWLMADDHDTGLLSELATHIGKLVGVEGVTCRFVQNMGGDEWDRTDPDLILVQSMMMTRFVFEDVKTERSSWGGDVSTGRVVMQVKGPKSFSGTTVRFAEKPWVENFQEFLSRNTDRQYLLVRSSSSCTSREQAHRQTTAETLTRVSEILRGMQTDSSILPANFNVTERELSSAGLIVDRFTQRFSGLSGPIWREAILVDTSEGKLSSLAQKKIGVTRMKRSSWFRMGATLVGMFLLICVVYMFLNAATRGYYSWALRIVLVILLIVGVLVVLNFA